MKFPSLYQPLANAKTSLLRYYLEENIGYYFGCNWKEADKEINGTGNEDGFGARIYDVRLGRCLSVDPLQKKYPFVSPCLFCVNNPIVYVDIDGKDYRYPIEIITDGRE